MWRLKPSDSAARSHVFCEVWEATGVGTGESASEGQRRGAKPGRSQRENRGRVSFLVFCFFAGLFRNNHEEPPYVVCGSCFLGVGGGVGVCVCVRFFFFGGGGPLNEDPRMGLSQGEPLFGW